MAYTLDNFTFKQLRSVVTRNPGWEAYRQEKGISSASSLSKEEMIGAAIDLGIDAADVMAAVEGDGTPAPKSAPEADAVPAFTPEPQPEAEAPAPKADAVPDPLASLRPVLSPAILAEADKAIAAVVAELAAERSRREAAERVEAFQPVAAQPGGTPRPKGATPSGTTTMGAAFGSRRADVKDIPLTVYSGGDRVPAKDPDYLWPEITPIAAAAAEAGEYCFFYGPRGTGKTSWAQQFAAITGRPYFGIPCDSDKAYADFFGFMGPDENGGISWIPGDVLVAMQTPAAIVSIEEIGTCRPELLTGPFLSLLQDRQILLKDGTVAKVAPGVVFMATNNNSGAEITSGVYAGLRPINSALRDRFSVFAEFDYLPAEREKRALMSRTGCNEQFAGLAVQFARLTRNDVAQGDMSDSVGFRRLVAWTKQTMRFPQMAELAFRVTVFDTFSEDDQARLDHHAKTQLDFAAIGKAFQPAPAAPEAAAPEAAAPAAAPKASGTRHGFTAV